MSEVSKISVVCVQDENESQGQSLSPKRPNRVTTMHTTFEPQSPAPSDGGGRLLRAPLTDAADNNRFKPSMQSPPRRTHTGTCSPQSPLRTPFASTYFAPTSPVMPDRIGISMTAAELPVIAQHVTNTIIQPPARLEAWNRASLSPRERSLSLTSQDASYTPGTGNAQRLSSAPLDVDGVTSSTTSLNPDRSSLGGSYCTTHMFEKAPEGRHPRMTEIRFNSPPRNFNAHPGCPGANTGYGPVPVTVQPVSNALSCSLGASLTRVPTMLPAQLQTEFMLSEGDQILGNGAFARIMKIKDKKGVVFALKVIDKDELDKRQMQASAQRELKYQRDVLNHENIVKCTQSLEADGHYWMVMEFASSGTLLTYSKSWLYPSVEQHAAFFMKQVCKAMVYLHSPEVAILHRDIKADNILLFANPQGLPSTAKLSDFGWSCSLNPAVDKDLCVSTAGPAPLDARQAKMISQLDGILHHEGSNLQVSSQVKELREEFAREFEAEQTAFQLASIPKDRAGTPGHMAPEVYHRCPHGRAADCWSFGVTLYEVVVRDVKCFVEDKDGQNLLKGNYDRRMPANVSGHAKDLWDKLFVFDPSFRLRADEILKHPVFATADNLPVPVPQLHQGTRSFEGARNGSLGTLHGVPPTPAASSNAPRAPHLPSAARESPRNYDSRMSTHHPMPHTRQTIAPEAARQARHTTASQCATVTAVPGPKQCQPPKAASKALPTMPMQPVPTQAPQYRHETPGPARVNAARHSNIHSLTSTQVAPNQQGSFTAPPLGMNGPPPKAAAPKRAVGGAVFRAVRQ